MNKKSVIFVSLLMMFLVIPMVSASVDYLEEEETYIIDSFFPTWLGGDGESYVELIDNTDYCLVDCEATLKFINEEPVNLLEGISFIDRYGEDVESNIKEIDFLIGKYKDVEKSIPIYEEVCETISGNETTYESCYQNKTGEEISYENKIVWEDYEGTKEAGENYLKVKAKKDPLKAMDWIIEFRGEELTRWAWWDNDWDYKREITITENSGGTLTDYQVRINVSYDSDMNSDFSDIRFLDSTESTELGYYIIEKVDSNYALVDVKVPSLTASSNTTIYLYYANSIASSDSDPKETYALYDDFEDGSINSTLWDQGDNACSEGSGYISCSASFSTYATIKSDDSFGLNYALDYDYWTTGAGGGAYGRGGWGLNPTFATRDTYLRSDLFYYSSSLYYNEDGTGGATTAISGVTQSTRTNYEIRRYSNVTEFYREGSLQTLTTKIYTGGLQVQTSGNGAITHIDNVKVRKQVYIPPTNTIGAEQQNAGNIVINFVSPPTPENYANLSAEEITIEVNATYTNSSLTNISYDFYNINGTLITEFFENETYQINITLPDSHFHYNVTICGNETIGNSVVCDSTETRHFNHDVTPPEIIVDSPTGEYDYLYVGQELDLNFTAIDKLANVSECLWNYNGINSSVACTNGTLVSVSIAQEYGKTSATIYSNDTFGNMGSNSTSWNYKILETNKTFNNETTEGAYEQFVLSMNEGGVAMVQSVVLHYNGQSDSSSLFSSGDNVTAISELLIDSVSADINKTFYFTVTLTDSTTFNTTSSIQLVRDISIDDCSSNPYPLLYLYLKDEEARTLLSGTIETNVEILNNFNYAQVLNISQEETGVSYVDLCSNVLLNETDFLINAEIRYNSENHSAEFYHIQRAALADYPVNISLFDLKTEDTTRFKVLYRNQDLIGVEGAILQLQRKYISDGIYEVVESPITSSDSSGVLHIDTNTNKYQITVVKDGEVLGLFQNLVFICESELTGECTINLYDKLIPPNIVPLVDLQDFSSALESSIDNQTITLTYVVPSGTATSIRVQAIQKDTILGDSVICNQTVISSAGSIECAYSTTIQDSKIDYKVFKSGELIAEKGYVVQEDLRDDWGGANYILLVVMMLSLVFMALSSPEWIVINAVVTVLIGGGIWLIRGIGFVEGLGSLMWLIVGAVILISKLSKQEDF